MEWEARAPWASLYRDMSRPFPTPGTGRIAFKVIHHFGDEVMKVFSIQARDPRKKVPRMTRGTEPEPPAPHYDKKELIRRFVTEPLQEIPKLKAEIDAIEKRMVLVRDPSSVALERARIAQLEKMITKIHATARENEKNILRAHRNRRETRKTANIPTPYGTTGWASVTYGKPVRG